MCAKIPSMSFILVGGGGRMTRDAPTPPPPPPPPSAGLDFYRVAIFRNAFIFGG